jgi:hypothetical protein
MRCKQHTRHFQLHQPQKSAIAEHTIHTGQFNNTCRLAKVKGYVDHLMKEAIKIQLHPNNFNGNGGFMFS